MVENYGQNPTEGVTTPAACNRFSTRQVENLFYEHPDLEEVAVFYISDDNNVDKLVAFIVLRRSGVTETQLMDFLIQSGQLEQNLMPNTIKIVPRIPKSPSGKVLRQRLLDDLHF